MMRLAIVLWAIRPEFLGPVFGLGWAAQIVHYGCGLWRFLSMQDLEQVGLCCAGQSMLMSTSISRSKNCSRNILKED